MADQQYEGDDISAIVTAKQRMAERDAEYSKQFAKLTADKKPRSRAKAAKPATDTSNYGNEGKSVAAKPEAGYSNEGRSVPVKVAEKVEPAAPKAKPASNNIYEPTFKAVSDATKGLTDATSVRYDDIANQPLQSDGERERLQSERSEYSAAWKEDE